MIKKVIEIVSKLLKLRKKSTKTLEEKGENLIPVKSQKEGKTTLDEESLYKRVNKPLIICRRLFYLLDSGEIRLASLSKKSKQNYSRRYKLSIKNYPGLKIDNVPKFKSANEVLNYFEKNYNIDRKKLCFFAASEKSELYYKIKKISKNGKERTLLIPSGFARKVQRIIHKDILCKIQFPEEMYGFIKGRNIVQALQKHTGKDVVISLDIKDFFENTTERKVYQAFREILGYPSEVASLITGLTTANTVYPYQEGSRKRVLPTGSPTSPIIANLCMARILHKINRRLSEISDKKNVQIDFSIYADNVIISYNSNGIQTSEELRKINDMIISKLSRVFRWYGYELNHLKTKVMRKKKRVLGLVINQKINIDRNYYRKLRAQTHRIYLKGIDQTDKKMIESLKGKLNYLRYINKAKYESLRRKYSAKLPELFTV
ncbi:MAG: reverse transcriptase family protein [Candidatus Calescibacterium sp.]|nr:reverse transcriptase family protein [Candidatus Calescibacterium sp.]MCX7972657.1 reverse transcriptase family protein [bacterium]MDW8194746.1 reverse transcriptase family protein [Candidatus Calescibacterium sp.]